MATNCNSFSSLCNNHLRCSKSSFSNKLFPRVSVYDPCSVSSASNIPDLEICTSGIITTATSSASKEDTVDEFFRKKAFFYNNICDTNITKGLIGARDLLDPITYTNFYDISCIRLLTMTLTLPLLFGAAGPAVASDGVRRMLTSTAFLENTLPSGKLMQLVAVLGMFSGATNVTITTLPLMVNSAQMAKILPILVQAMLLLPLMVQQLLSRSASVENSGGDKEAQDSASMVNTLPMAKILTLLVVVQRLLPILLLLPILQQLLSPSEENSGGDKAAHEQNNTTDLIGSFSLILNKLGYEIMQHFMDLKVGVLFNPMKIKDMDLNATAKKVVLPHIITPFLNKKGCDMLQHIAGGDFTNALISFAFFYVLLCTKGALEAR